MEVWIEQFRRFVYWYIFLKSVLKVKVWLAMKNKLVRKGGITFWRVTPGRKSCIYYCVISISKTILICRLTVLSYVNKYCWFVAEFDVATGEAYSWTPGAFLTRCIIGIWQCFHKVKKLPPVQEYSTLQARPKLFCTRSKILIKITQSILTYDLLSSSVMSNCKSCAAFSA